MPDTWDMTQQPLYPIVLTSIDKLQDAIAFPRHLVWVNKTRFW